MPLPVEEQVVVIFAGVRGYLDGIDLADIGRFEAQLLERVRGQHGDILQGIRDQGEISQEVEKKLAEVMEALAKSFS